VRKTPYLKSKLMLRDSRNSPNNIVSNAMPSLMEKMLIPDSCLSSKIPQSQPLLLSLYKIQSQLVRASLIDERMPLHSRLLCHPPDEKFKNSKIHGTENLTLRRAARSRTRSP
jgi:hypothetical protein